MKCWLLWDGGSSYSTGNIPEDLEQFDSLRELKNSFWRRLDDPFYPVVSDETQDEGGQSGWVFFADPSDSADPYPDRIISHGPRGGICPGYKIGSRHDHEDGMWTAAACGNVWCKEGGAHKDLPGAEYHDVLTEEAEAAKITLERIHNAYNHDGSDVMTDYFDVNYYGHVNFQTASSARWEAEEKARQAAKKLA